MFVFMTVDKNSTTKEEKAAGDSQELFTLDILKMYSKIVNVIPASYTILHLIENCFTSYLQISNAQLYSCS